MWQDAGAKNIAQRIRERLEEIRDTHQPPALPDNVPTALDHLKRKVDEEVKAEQSRTA